MEKYSLVSVARLPLTRGNLLTNTIHIRLQLLDTQASLCGLRLHTYIT